VIAAPLLRWRRARLINWLQDLFPEVAAALGMRGLRGPLGAALLALRNASLRQAEMNVVIGEGMRVHLLAQGIAAPRLQVIHNWSDGEGIVPLAPQVNPLRTDWDLQGRFVVGYSGNLGRAHEYATLLEAATLLRDDPQVVFLIIGDGALLAGLKAEAARRGLRNFRFQPYQPAERLRESLGLPDVHLVVLRPELEGLIVPSKIYGIAAAGRPALFIGAADGEIAGLLTQHAAGLCCAVGDAATLVAHIRRLQTDPAARTAMGQNARALFERQFAAPLALGQWQRLLHGVGETA